MFNRPIEIYAHRAEPLNVFHGSYATAEPPIRLSYHDGNHYNAVIDPNNATIGVGLGMPSLEPGLADHNALAQGVQVSEQDHIEHMMMKEAQEAAEQDLIERELALQAIRESEREAGAFDGTDLGECELMEVEAAMERAAMEASLREFAQQTSERPEGQ
eukprot:TRINITY_DN1896_c0_g3_i3.p1 TRINITY_DN1896_c0_g3~~TRINITY_DN1896_c0_g3_i3.p1  ORF type:complete len:159 (-),score=33.25 TRINITY_DN1896_c0_g3_i3:43-519(-)